MGGRVDLEPIERAIGATSQPYMTQPGSPYNWGESVCMHGSVAADLLAELRAARRVVDLLPDWAALNLAAIRSGDDKLRRQLYDTGNALAEYRRTFGAQP